MNPQASNPETSHTDRITERQPLPGEMHRLRGVLSYRGDIGKSKHYEDIKKGLWTPPVKENEAARSPAGWPVRESIALNLARIAGKSQDEIRTLVRQLMAARTAERGAGVDNTHGRLTGPPTSGVIEERRPADCDRGSPGARPMGRPP